MASRFRSVIRLYPQIFRTNSKLRTLHFRRLPSGPFLLSSPPVTTPARYFPRGCVSYFRSFAKLHRWVPRERLYHSLGSTDCQGPPRFAPPQLVLWSSLPFAGIHDFCSSSNNTSLGNTSPPAQGKAAFPLVSTSFPLPPAMPFSDGPSVFVPDPL